MLARIYNLSVRLYVLAIQLAAPFHRKANEWLAGRRNWQTELKAKLGGAEHILWFHAASLGEAEQGLPVIENMRKKYPGKKILLSFFSPSGMKHFKKNPAVDFTHYLPADTPENAREFVALVKPELAFFIKYEIWANFLKSLQENTIPTVIAPAIFRSEQIYFRRAFRPFFLPILKRVSRILTQDEKSVILLKSYGIRQAKVVGDSRYDRVLENLHSPLEAPALEKFARGSRVLVAGSTWPPDEQILKKVARMCPDLKFIFAPHDVRSSNTLRLQKLLGSHQTLLLSEASGNVGEHRFLIVDNIGMLSKIYRLGHLAYIGGAFGQGIHNSLEAAAYGLPLFFGPRHRAFIEPAEMISAGFAFEIHNAPQMTRQVQALMENPGILESLSHQASHYVKSKAGAVEKILNEVEPLIA